MNDDKEKSQEENEIKPSQGDKTAEVIKRDIDRRNYQEAPLAEEEGTDSGGPNLRQNIEENKED